MLIVDKMLIIIKHLFTNSQQINKSVCGLNVNKFVVFIYVLLIVGKISLFLGNLDFFMLIFWG
jgi:hypothetical protein